MADAYIQVPVDSLGKKVDTSEIVVNSQTVERQRIVHGDPTDPAGLAPVLQVPPTSGYGSVVRPLEAPTAAVRFVSGASINAVVVKNTAGVVYGYEIYNNAGYQVFVKFYNKATAPTPGSDSALLLRTIGIQAGTRAFFASKNGFGGFINGIGLVIVKNIADTDATAVAAGDCAVTVDYL